MIPAISFHHHAIMQPCRYAVSSLTKQGNSSKHATKKSKTNRDRRDRTTKSQSTVQNIRPARSYAHTRNDGNRTGYNATQRENKTATCTISFHQHRTNRQATSI